MKRLKKYAECVSEYRLYTKGKKYFIYDITQRSYKLKNDTGTLEYVPNKYFRGYRSEFVWIKRKWQDKN